MFLTIYMPLQHEVVVRLKKFAMTLLWLSYPKEEQNVLVLSIQKNSRSIIIGDRRYKRKEWCVPASQRETKTTWLITLFTKLKV